MTNTKLKNIITSAVFILIIASLSLACLFHTPNSYSDSERRKLEQFPELTLENVFSGKFFEKFEKYAADQFPMREGFRSLKSVSRFYLLGRQENNGIYISDGVAVKKETEINADRVASNVKLWQNICNKYFPDANVYFSIIPDKNYYASGNKYPHYDYSEFMNIVSSNAPAHSNYIDIFDSLTISDYYHTDIHWKQESIYGIAAKLATAMGTKIDPEDSYRIEDLGDFYGVYYGQSALPLSPDKLNVLKNNTTENAKVYLYGYKDNAYFKDETVVYSPDDMDSSDRYDIFLSGPESLVEIINPNNKNGKTLFIFRDSFGSSISPLLISGYERIVLVDTRYMASALLSDPQLGLNMETTDVLFLYTTTTLNDTVMR